MSPKAVIPEKAEQAANRTKPGRGGGRPVRCRACAGAVISVGKGNTYGHPAPRTVALASGAGARVFRTDQDGQVVLFGTAGRLRVAMRH